MKPNLKCLFLILIFALTSVIADDAKMISAFMRNYPNNIKLTPGNFTTDEKICICGLNTETVKSLGEHMEMYKLAQANWVWNDAAELGEKSLWKNNLIESGYMGSRMWFSPGDSSFASYNIPRAQMKATIEAFHEILSVAEITATVEDCVINMSYLPPNWYSVVNSKNRSTKDQREAFVEAHGMKDHYFEYWEKDKLINAYPADFTGLTTTWDKKAPKTKLTIKEVRKLNRNNSVVCHITIQHKTDKAPKKANLVYLDVNTKNRFFYKIGNPLVYQNGYEAATLLYELYESSDTRSIDLRSSNLAFMFTHDLDTIDLDNRDEVIENLILPNSFEYNICDQLLNPSSIGKLYNIDHDKEWTKVFDKYIKNCPMITWKGHMTYSVPDKNSPGGKKYFKRPTLFDKDKSMFIEVSDDLEPQADLYKMKDIIYDSSSINFAKSETFDEVLEKAVNGNIEAEKNDEEKEAEKEKVPEKDPSEPQETPQPTQQEIEQAIIDAKKAIEGKEDNDEDEGENNDEENDETHVSSHHSGVSETAEMNTTSIIQIRSCEERRVEIEEMLQDQVPKTKILAATFINLMIQHPHMIDCKEMVKYSFSYNDDGGVVRNLNPQGDVMHWKVRTVNHFKFDPQMKDPEKVVYEVIFYNHNFEEQKDALYYIPAREIVNEWDKFPFILEDFFNFAETKLGEVLDVVSIYEKMKSYVGEQMKIMGTSKGWLINDANTGPLELPGNSTATEFASRFSNPNANYIIRFFKLEEPNHRGSYEFVFQCWRIGEKYMMVKINGTQFDYSVLINKYSNEEKLNEIWQGLFTQFDQDFFQDDAVVSLLQIKRTVHKLMKEKALKYKFGFEYNLIPIEEDEYDVADKGHDYMENNDLTAFMYTFEAVKVDKSVNVRGFVHFRENISILNLFFSTDMFESEYIIPLSNSTAFESYVNDIFEECYIHMHLLLKQISLVEGGTLTDAQLDEEQNLGRYSMKKLLFKTLEMLSTKTVYGCIANFEIPVSETKYDDDGNVVPAEDSVDEDDPDANKRQYKWTVEQEDLTGEFLMLRSNYKFVDVKTSKCDPDELMNPTLIHLYSTRLDDRNGYALTVNSPNFEMNKDIKTTYHFVKYQDYAHMRVFEQFIGKVFNQMFDPEPEKVDEAKAEE